MSVLVSTRLNLSSLVSAKHCLNTVIGTAAGETRVANVAGAAGAKAGLVHQRETKMKLDKQSEKRK